MFFDNIVIKRSEVKKAQFCLGVIKLHGRKNNSSTTNDILREYRKKLKGTELPSEILQYRAIDDGFSFKEIFLLDCFVESDVIKFIEKNQLPQEYQDAPCTIYDCSGAIIGGEPIIKKICANRYLLKYYWTIDV